MTSDGWCKMLILVSWVCYNNIPRTGWLRTTEIDCPTIPEARSPKSMCWQDHAPSESYRKAPPFSLACDDFPASLPSLGLWLHHCSPLSSQSLSSVRVFVSTFLLKRVSAILDEGPPWPHFNLITSAKTLFSKRGSFEDTGGILSYFRGHHSSHSLWKQTLFFELKLLRSNLFFLWNIITLIKLPL